MVNTKLEVISDMSGVKITVPINVVYEFEKVSESELKYSLNLSLNAMNTEFEVTISGGRKIIDYSQVTIPSDSEVDAFDEEMLEEIGKKVVEVYPGIGEFIDSLGNNTIDPANSEMYFAEDG